MLQSSEHFEHANHHFADHGISAKDIKMDVAKMIGRKDAVVKQNNDGILYLFKKNKVSFFHGRGSFVKATEGGYEIKVAGAAEETHGGQAHHRRHGLQRRALPGVPFDEVNVLSNDGALRRCRATPKLGVIGSGVIGLEMGSCGAAWVRMSPFWKACPRSWAPWTSRSPKGSQEGVRQARPENRTGREGGRDQEQQVWREHCLHQCQGRSPDAGRRQADRLHRPRAQHHWPERRSRGPATGRARGEIVVDGDCKTNLPGVWAVGDVVRGPMLAHKAEEEGVAVAERIAGQHGTSTQHHPWVIYTSPEIAWVGRTEQQLKADGVKYKAGTFPFLANGRARALGDRPAWSVLADAATGQILGVHRRPHGQS